MSEAKKTNDGGPAFPVNQLVTVHGEIVGGGAVGGMTLRDYFAAKALEGEMANPDCGVWASDATLEHISPRALLYYRIADAMLAAREAQ